MAARERFWSSLVVTSILLACVPWWWMRLSTERAPMPRDRRLQASMRDDRSRRLLLEVQLHVRSEGFRKACDLFRDVWNVEFDKETDALDMLCEGRARNHVDDGWTEEADPIRAEEKLQHGLEALENHEDVPGRFHVSITRRKHGSKSKEIRAFVGTGRCAWILLPSTPSSNNRNEDDAQALVKEAFPIVKEIVDKYLLLEKGGIHSEEGAAALRLDPSGVVLFSFMLNIADPTERAYSWDFQAIKDALIEPAIEALSPIAEISVRGQRLQHASPKVLPSLMHHDGYNAWVVGEEDLSFFVDASLPSTGHARAAMQWILYVPSPLHCPLHIRTKVGKLAKEDAFLIPKWGGVIILNPSNCSHVHSSRSIKVSNHKQEDILLGPQELLPAMGLVLAQMREMLGLPPQPKITTGPGWTIQALPSQQSGFAEWEVDSMARELVERDIEATLQSLQSLENLFDSIPNVVICQNIPSRASEALLHLEDAMEAVKENRYWQAALSARRARGIASGAYFHPTILSLLYFPQDHKIAVYAPLFLPVFTVTLITAMKSYKYHSKKNRMAMLKDKCKKEE